MNQHRVVLDPTLRSIDAQEFERQLRERVVGQDPAVEKLTLAFQTFLTGSTHRASLWLTDSWVRLDSALKTSVQPGPRLPPPPSPYLHPTATEGLGRGRKWRERKGVVKYGEQPSPTTIHMARRLFDQHSIAVRNWRMGGAECCGKVVELQRKVAESDDSMVDV
jgi:hypothetical protein